MIKKILHRSVNQTIKAIALLLASFLFTVAGSPAAGPNDTLSKDFPELTRRMAKNQVADFVILLDKSASMKPFWQSVKVAISTFVEAIPEGDYLSLVLFGTDTQYATTPGPINAATRMQLLQEIDRIGSPTDQKTDLGTAFEKALHELNRPQGSRLKFVFFLTDFDHDPGGSSKYAGPAAIDHPMWKALLKQRGNEQKDNALQVFALLLPLGGRVGKDIKVGRAIFPEIVEVAVNKTTLVPWFERRKAEIARDKLRALVQDECLKGPFTIEGLSTRQGFLSTKPQVVASLSKRKRVMTDSVKTEIATWEGSPRSDSGSPFVLKSLAAKTPVPEDSKTALPVFSLSFPAFPFFKKTIDTEFVVKAYGRQTLSPRGELEKLNIDPDRPFSVSAVLPVRITYGYVSVWTICILVGGICLLGGGLGYYMRPQYVSGRVNIIPTVGLREIKRAEKHRTVKIGDVSGQDGIRIDGVTWRLVLQGFRPFQGSVRQRGVYARMEQGQAVASYHGKTTALTNQGWTRLPKGSVVTASQTNTRIDFT